MDPLSPRRLLLAVVASVLVLACTGQPLPLEPEASDVTVSRGQQADLVCSYNAADIISITIAKVIPLANATLTRTILIDNAGGGQTLTFTIFTAAITDSGTYRCVVITNGGLANKIFNLLVRDEFALISPPIATTVQHRGDAQFSCEYNEPVEVKWFRNGIKISQNDSQYVLSGIGERVLTVVSVGYLDEGPYVCQINTTLAAIVELSANLTLTPAYMALMTEGEAGQSVIVTTDQLKVRCPVDGVPGAMFVYWQFGISIVGANITRVPQTAAPYVDDAGQLDFTTASDVDTGHYRCTGVDIRGARAGHVFFVEVTHNDNFFLWLEWYMILVYCVVLITLVMLFFLFIWFCAVVKPLWCVKVRKNIKRKERVKRSTRPPLSRQPLSFRPGEPYIGEEEEGEEVFYEEDEEIDDTLFEEEEEEEP